MTQKKSHMAAVLLQLFMGRIWSLLVLVKRAPEISVSFGTGHVWGQEIKVCDTLSLTPLAKVSLVTTFTAQLFAPPHLQSCGGAQIPQEHRDTAMTDVQSLCIPTAVFAASPDLS